MKLQKRAMKNKTQNLHHFCELSIQWRALPLNLMIKLVQYKPNKYLHFTRWWLLDQELVYQWSRF